MNIFKDGLSKIKDRFTKTELQRKLKEATSNEHCHANVSLLDEIAQKTANYNDFQVIVTYCIKRLLSKKEKWRRILKCLLLIEHILKVGSPNFYDSFKAETRKLQNLNTFSFIDTNRVDKGETIRQKSKEILVLLSDKSKLKEEREKYSVWKNRIEGVSSSGKVGSVSSSSYYGSSVSSNNYSKNSPKKQENKKVVESSSSSEEEKKPKKSKKKKVQSESESEPESEDEKKKQKPKKTEKNEKGKNDSEKQEEKAKVRANIHIKKPGKKEKDDDSFTFIQETPSVSTKVDIDDIFTVSKPVEKQIINTTNKGNGLDEIFTFVSDTSTTKKTNDPLVGVNFTNTPITTTPQSSQETKINPNDLLKIMYSNNNNTPVQNNGYGIGGFPQPNNNGNMMNQNHINPMFIMMNNNMNSHPMNNFNNPMNNFNNPMNNFNNPMNNFNNPMNNFNNPMNNFNHQNNFSNTPKTNFNMPPNNYNQPLNNNNINTQFKNMNLSSNTKLNNNLPFTNKNIDDDFKEVEEDDSFKINNQKKGGLNNLLDSKLVDLSNLKSGNKVGNSTTSNNFNFIY